MYFRSYTCCQVLDRLYFQSSFSFTAELSRRHICHVASSIHRTQHRLLFTPEYNALITIDAPVGRQVTTHTQSVIHTGIYNWCCASFGFLHCLLHRTRRIVSLLKQPLTPAVYPFLLPPGPVVLRSAYFCLFQNVIVHK